MSTLFDNGIARCAAGLARVGIAVSLLGGSPLADELTDDSDETKFELHVAEGRVSISALDVPVQKVLDEIASQSGLVLIQESPLQGNLTVTMRRLPIGLALRQVLRNISYQLYEAAPRRASDEIGGERPSTLWIFSAAIATRSAAVKFLETEILDGDVRARKDAVKALANIGSVSVVGSLSLALADAEPGVRIAAIDSLARIGGEEALAALASAAMDDDPWVRGEAAYALAEIGERSSVQYLALAMNDGDPAVRASVAGAYADLPFENAVPALTLALQDPDPSVRLEAVEALEEIGGAAALRALSNIEPDGDAGVQDAINE